MRLARIAAFAAAALAMTLAAAREVSAQDLGIERGSMAPGAKVADARRKGRRPLGVHRQDARRDGVLGGLVPELQRARADAARGVEEVRRPQVKFIGVAVSVNETPDRVKAFVEKHGLPGDQFFDNKGNATNAYDVPATSFVVVIDKTGKVVYTGLGGKQDLDAEIKKAM